MASRHSTKKRTLRGRYETAHRDEIRRLKYATGALDIPRLTSELCRTQVGA